jgi:outer membrane lipoprotein-sorting protein
MNDERHEEILKQVDTLLDIVPSPESTQRAMARTESTLLAEMGGRPKVAGSSQRRRPVDVRMICAGAAASVVIVAGLMILGDGGSETFAQVQEKLRRVRTVTYKYVVSQDGKLTSLWMISGHRTRREESTGDIYVADPEQGLSMHVRVAEKSVRIRHDSADRKGPSKDSKSLYDRLRTLHHDSAKRKGERQVDGKNAVGFVVAEPGNEMEMTVWVEKETQLPIRIEAAGDRVLKDFAFDVPLKDELFEIKAPEGYRVEHRYDSPQPPAKLSEKESASLMALVNDDKRSARQTAEVFLRLALAGREDDASRLGAAAKDRAEIRQNAAEIRQLDGFQSLKIVSIYASQEAALAITSKVNYRGAEHALVMHMAFHNNRWLIDDIDLESESGLKEEKDRFLRDHPQAKELSAAESRPEPVRQVVDETTVSQAVDIILMKYVATVAVDNGEIVWLSLNEISPSSEVEIQKLHDAGYVHFHASRGPGQGHKPFGDVDLSQIVRTHHKLRVLDLRHTNVTDRGLAHLRELHALEWLWLDRSQCTDVGFEHLNGLASLRQLSVDAGKAENDGITKLEQALPKCKIVRR